MNSSRAIPVLALFATMALAVTGCQTVKPGESDLKNRAQTTIGKPVIKVSNIRSDFNTTFYTAQTESGEYTCELPSGPMVALGSMGMGLGAQCTKQ